LVSLKLTVCMVQLQTLQGAFTQRTALHDTGRCRTVSSGTSGTVCQGFQHCRPVPRERLFTQGAPVFNELKHPAQKLVHCPCFTSHKSFMRYNSLLTYWLLSFIRVSIILLPYQQHPKWPTSTSHILQRRSTKQSDSNHFDSEICSHVCKRSDNSAPPRIIVRR